jgi:DNA-binding NarL/FixJ family response regulator
MVRMLVWSTHSESLYAERALRAGALGYVNKDQATDKIVEGIRTVLEGKVYLSDAMVETMLQRTVGEERKELTRSPLDALTNRELEVFRLIGQGIKTSTIAERLHLSVKTIETYRERIREKLDLSDGTELAHYATKWLLENG